jgi:2'-5' RNA ligase
VSEQRARLFVALELSDGVRDELVAWRDEALGRSDGARPIRSPDLHATLCFLGWRRDGEIEEIAEGCGVLGGHRAPELSLGEALALPRRRPRVLAVALEDLDGTLAATQATLSATLEAGGWYEPERRPYLPHVTVARLGRDARLPGGGPPTAPPQLRFHGARVTLYRSRLDGTGPRYEPLRQVELGSPR